MLFIARMRRISACATCLIFDNELPMHERSMQLIALQLCMHLQEWYFRSLWPSLLIGR